ncbi:hypothetical protein NGRA_2273 [Nosema granulosis]|uniref:Uncharacterized protein n=1 Tax=Nosema granulosis TaxID=83296 RepID=A0A9P6GYG0_9MICR|nr:hypothetical protein NGRA_2273 [Nosema granulosis]
MTYYDGEEYRETLPRDVDDEYWLNTEGPDPRDRYVPWIEEDGSCCCWVQESYILDLMKEAEEKKQQSIMTLKSTKEKKTKQINKKRNPKKVVHKANKNKGKPTTKNTIKPKKVVLNTSPTVYSPSITPNKETKDKQRLSTIIDKIDTITPPDIETSSLSEIFTEPIETSISINSIDPPNKEIEDKQRLLEIQKQINSIPPDIETSSLSEPIETSITRNSIDPPNKETEDKQRLLEIQKQINSIPPDIETSSLSEIITEPIETSISRMFNFKDMINFWKNLESKNKLK